MFITIFTFIICRKNKICKKNSTTNTNLNSISVTTHSITSELSEISKSKNKEFDCFLTHDWGTDELNRSNHQRVGKINKALQKAGYITWFDEECMTGNINKQMTAGIDKSKTVIVFITQRYIQKVDGEGERGEDDNCKFEFEYSLARKGVGAMIAVVMEPRCRNTSYWQGVVGGKLGCKLYADYSNDDKESFQNAFCMILAEIKNIITQHNLIEHIPSSIELANDIPNHPVI